MKKARNENGLPIEDAAALSAQIRSAFLQSARLAIREDGKYVLRSILESIDDEQLDLMLHALECNAHYDFVPAGGKTGRAGKRTKLDRAGVIDVVLEQSTMPTLISHHIALMTPPLVDVFEQACSSATGVALDEALLVAAIQQIPNPVQLLELDMAQLFGLGFIAADESVLRMSESQRADADPEAFALRFVVPDEVKAACQAIQFSEIKQLADAFHIADMLARAAANLYGAIPLTELAALCRRMFNRLGDSRIEIDDHFWDQSLTCHMAFQTTYFIAAYHGRDYLLHTSLAYEDESGEIEPGEEGYQADTTALAYLLEQQRGKEWYAPPIEEFLCYADDDYYEQTEPVKALRALFKSVCVGFMEHGERSTPMQQREGLLSDLHQTILLSGDLSEMFAIISDWHVKMDKVEKASGGMNALLAMLTNMSNATRLWANCGWTPLEMVRQATQGGVTRFPRKNSAGPQLH